MNAFGEREDGTLMEHFFKDKRPHSPRLSRQGDIIDRCLCSEKNNSISNYYVNRSRKEKLVVYIRVPSEELLDEKLQLIKAYCADNGYQVHDIFSDVGDHPSFGFKAALDEMENADGLITVDLNQFVGSKSDRIRELRPLIHHFFCGGGKHLITVEDGIDTGTKLGQQNAIALISESKVGFET